MNKELEHLKNKSEETTKTVPSMNTTFLP